MEERCSFKSFSLNDLFDLFSVNKGFLQFKANSHCLIDLTEFPDDLISVKSNLCYSLQECFERSLPFSFQAILKQSLSYLSLVSICTAYRDLSSLHIQI